MERRSSFSVYHRIITGALLLLSAALAVSAQDDKPRPRDIVPVFETSRPPSAASPGSAANKPPTVNSSSAANKPKRPTYNRISQKINSGKVNKIDRPGATRPPQSKPPADIPVASAQQVGVTLWKLLPARFRGAPPAGADDEYIPQVNSGRTNYLTPARVSLDTIFETGDYVRLSVESGRRGYLYIVDQEMYTDGTTGDAYLVFPNRRLKGGANLVAPGSPAEIPDLSNNPFYFELRPQSQNGKRIMAEVLSIIITDRPIPGLQITDQPQRISEATLNGWRAKWAGRAEIFEPSEKTTTGYTKTERAAAGGRQKLGANDPLPQTVFLVEGNRNGGTLITVPLWYGSE